MFIQVILNFNKSFDAIQIGKNAVIASETGSGKTLAYLVPILNEILTKKCVDSYTTVSPRGAIILVPTKELGA